MNLIAKVTSSGPQKPLGDVLRTPDVWEIKPDHLILRGTEAQLDRLSSRGTSSSNLRMWPSPRPRRLSSIMAAFESGVQDRADLMAIVDNKDQWTA
jgi:hypothetical protein